MYFFFLCPLSRLINQIEYVFLINLTSSPLFNMRLKFHHATITEFFLLTGCPDPLFVEMYNPGAQDMVDVPPPPMIVPPPIPPPAAPFDELIQQSQWNLQQQEQHLHTLRQVQEANMSRNIAARLSVKQIDSLGLLECVSFVTMVIINEPVCVCV